MARKATNTADQAASADNRSLWEGTTPGLPSAMRPVRFPVPDRVICMDTETTGLFVHDGDRMISIGAVEVVGDTVGAQHEWMIDPGRDIDPEAVRIHGITRADLAGKPRFAGVAQEFLDFIGDSALVIHNSDFDIGFIDWELNLLGMARPRGQQVIDTLNLARRSLAPGKATKLDAVMKLMGIDWIDRETHGALKDSLALAYVYRGFRKAALDLPPLPAPVPHDLPIRPIRPQMFNPALTAALAAEPAAVAEPTP